MADIPVVPEPAPAMPVAPKKAAPKKTAKAMSKSQIAGYLAEKVGITKKLSVQYLEELVKLALKEAKNSFTIPGLGKLVLVKTKPRTIVVPFGEHKGETRKVPAKKVLRFRVAKAAKDALMK
jgi:DNA-binding protein HU-beta